ncbi:MAG: STAS domain-containing protein [Anaerolineaceae bacterium]|jgi:anti-anti-sigma factor
MEISTTEFKRCDLIKITGRLDSSAAPQLSDVINACNSNGKFRIVISLKDATFVSSAGMRVLIATQKNCKRYNRGELVLSEVPENILAALDLAGFTSLFKIFKDDLNAVANF